MTDHPDIPADLLARAQTEVGKPPDRDQLEARVQIYKITGSQRAAAAALDMDKGQFNRHMKKAAKLGLTGHAAVQTAPGFEVGQMSDRYDRDGNLIGQTVVSVPEAGEVFEALPGHFIKGESAFVDPDGRIRGKWIKTQQGIEQTQALIDAVKAAFQDIPRAPVLPTLATPPKPDLLNLLPVADVHLGMLAWAKETGAAYDTAIAEAIFRDVYGRLIKNAMPAEELVILGLGDITHANDDTARTKASGNALDVDSRHDRVVLLACHLMVWLVELGLEKHQHVRVRMVKGNHDPEVTTAIAIALAFRFEDNPRVTVDLSPALVWMHRWGETTLAGFHGHTFKAARIFALVADWFRREKEVPTNWVRAYKGHTHHADLIKDSDGNGTCETMQTICAPDAYHAGAAYISDRAACLITHHRRQPDYARQTISVTPDILEGIAA